MADCNDQRIPGDSVKLLPDQQAVLPIHSRKGLVQQIDGGILQKGPGQKQAFALAAGEFSPSVDHMGLQPLFQPQNPSVQSQPLQQSQNFSVIRPGPPQNVVPDSPLEQRVFPFPLSPLMT